MGIAYQAQPLPATDANGRLVLKEATSNVFGMVLIILCICGFALACAAYWFQLLYNGGVPAVFSVVQIKLCAALGVASPLALPYCIRWLKNPPCLVIDDAGIELREPGHSRRMAWQDMREIKTDVIRDTRKTFVNGAGTFDSYAVTVVRGQSEAIVLNQDFGVAATALTAYLLQRQNENSGAGLKLTDMGLASAEKFETRGRLLNKFRVVVFLALLVGLIAFLGFLLWARMTLF